MELISLVREEPPNLASPQSLMMARIESTTFQEATGLEPMD
ncbi:MAG: hypothetical protein R6U98_20915 [Pirellulaceae bacterium]